MFIADFSVCAESTPCPGQPQQRAACLVMPDVAVKSSVRGGLSYPAHRTKQASATVKNTAQQSEHESSESDDIAVTSGSDSI
nr:hypothetical protein CFP56_78961 [Quercus suber]